MKRRRIRKNRLKEAQIEIEKESGYINVGERKKERKKKERKNG